MVLDGTRSVYDDTGWRYCLVLGGYSQQRACMPVYIGKSGDLVGCYRCLTYSQTTEYRATQLVSSIKFKLSHAMKRQIEKVSHEFNLKPLCQIHNKCPSQI